MSDERPTSLAEAAALRKLLGQLGGAEAKPREADDESDREARIAARLDAALEGLVTERRASRRRWFGLAAAAALLLGLGGHYLHSGPGSALIAREPLLPGAARTTPHAAPSALPAAPPPRVPSPPRVVNVPAPPSAPASNTAPAGASPSAESASTLGEENRLFKAAAESTRQGDVGAALGSLDKLLSEHPGSPLAQTALVRKFRLLASSGKPEEARREAARYLATYPTGFAVSEAQGLKDGGSP